MLVLSLPTFENKKYTAYDHFHRNGPYGEIPTEKEPIRMLGFTLPYNKYILLDVRIRIFTRCLYFDSPYGLAKIRHNS